MTALQVTNKEHARCENGDTPAVKTETVRAQENHPTGATCDIQVTSEGTTTSITRKDDLKNSHRTSLI